MAKKKTSKKSSPSLIPSTEQTQVIPKDLQDQMGAIEACATAFTCLDKAYLPHNYAAAVKASLQFLGKLHEQSVELALKHPQAHMVPELKDAMKAQKAEPIPHIEMEAQDGEVQTIN